jgi:hypothetical protein
MKAGSRNRTRPSFAAAAPQLLLLLLTGSQVACAGKPFVLEGDANYAGVTYAGDIESATAAAKRHCAPYERVPRFREIDESVAYFDCVRP